MASLPCFHVSASNGLLYGVAAGNRTEAKTILQNRLREDAALDGERAVPVKAQHIGSCDWDYGTTICYGEAGK